MAQFTLTIDLGNDAMRTYADISEATRKIFADFTRRTGLCQDDTGRVYDANGNHVGDWACDEVEEEEEICDGCGEVVSECTCDETD